MQEPIRVGNVLLYKGDALEYYNTWAEPTTIIADAGMQSPEWYQPHIDAWTRKSTSHTTLWLWNNPIGWVSIHPLLEKEGWIYKGSNFWNKGIITGKATTHFPATVDVCAQYIRPPTFVNDFDGKVTLSIFLRSEWKRAGFNLSMANQVCGVKSAATRKYLTLDNQWYEPTPEMIERLRVYANEHGDPENKPYFVIPDNLEKASPWYSLQAFFHPQDGITNLWNDPLPRNERMKVNNHWVFAGQKPLSIMKRLIIASSHHGDMVWEPFGGLCTATLAALQTDRCCNTAELLDTNYDLAVKRMTAKPELDLFPDTFDVIGETTGPEQLMLDL